MLSLREKLNTLPDIDSKENFDRQRTLLESKFRDEYQHTIEHSKYCECKFPTLQMCYSYALGVPDDILGKYYFNYRGFLKFLIDEKFLAKDPSGKLVLYGNYPTFEHAGLRINNTNRVISRWGSGHIWEHNIDEVPEMYGNFDFYNLLSRVEILKKLQEYAIKINYKRAIN